MRVRNANKQISAHAIAGSHVVMLGLDAKPAVAKRLLGFSISRKGPRDKSFKTLAGSREFAGLKGGPSVVQAFLWGDYQVSPATTYTYRIVPIMGKPDEPVEGDALTMEVTSEDPDAGDHAVYFNRGVAGSQSYSRRFGEYRRFYKTDPNETDPRKIRYEEFLRPEDVPKKDAYTWLSRGLEEALLAFIAQASGPEYSIRACLYELTHRPAVEAFVAAIEAGADVKVIHHAKEINSKQVKTNRSATMTVTYDDGTAPVVFKNREIRTIPVPDGVALAANITVANVGVPAKSRDAYARMLIPRKDTTISHNKFIILLKDGVPQQVWTGSTNVTGGGIFAQSNVGHIIRDKDIAASYLAFWEKLSTDPKKSKKKGDDPGDSIREWTVLQQPDLVDDPPADSITPVFSPRLDDGMLQWYANRINGAKNSVFFTAAFSVANEIMNEVTKTKKTPPDEPYLRYLLLEGKGGLLKDKFPVMKRVKQNRIAYGDMLRARKGQEDQLIEALTGLNDHVNYLHTKYMLVDPLGDDPIVISGSANFSTASTVNNDENMLIIRGNTRVADMFLVEFMRLFNHFYGRNTVNAMSDEEEAATSSPAPNSSWATAAFTEGTQEYDERRLFA